MYLNPFWLIKMDKTQKTWEKNQNEPECQHQD